MRWDEFIRGIKRFCGFLQDQVEKGENNLLKFCAPCVFAGNNFLFRLVRVRPSK